MGPWTRSSYRLERVCIRPCPLRRWPKKFNYLDWGLEQANGTDLVCVNRGIVEPWRQCFPVPSADIGESEDLLSDEDLDLVQGYMDRPFHDWVSQREGKGQVKPGGKWRPSLVPMTGIPSSEGYWTTCPARTRL